MRNWELRLAISLFLVIQISSIFAHNTDDELPITNAQELAVWCQHEVEQLYLANDQEPRNWRISHVMKGNYIHVQLTFRINDEDKIAACRIRKGAQRRYAIFKSEVNNER